MIKITSLATLALLAFTGMAHAATIDLDVTLGPSVTYSTGGTYTPNLSLFPASSSGLTLTGDAHIVPGFVSIPNIVTRPLGALLQNDYLAVIHNPGPAGTATFNLGAGDNSFAFKWGTIDDYNSILFTLSGGSTVTITGADILSHLSGSPVSGAAQANVSFSDPFGSIVSAKFLTTQNSFEAANFFEGDPSPTPLPPSVWLFGSALLALAFFSRRSSRTKA